jgi:c-di-GMP-binding flagellar brake protein YcgR
MNLNKIPENNRRKNVRIDVSLDCKIFYQNIKVKGKILNLSASGAKILCDQEIHEEKKIILNFEFNSEFFIINCKLVKKENEMISVSFQKNKELDKILTIIEIGDDLI